MQLLSECRDSEVSKEVEHASQSVRQLGSLLFEMEVLRSFLETEQELKYFDKRVIPCKVKAFIAIGKLKGKIPINTKVFFQQYCECMFRV